MFFLAGAGGLQTELVGKTIVPRYGPSASHVCLELPKTRCVLTRPSLFRLYLVILLLCISCPILLSPHPRQVSQILLSHFHWQMLLKLFSTSPMRFCVCFLLAFSIFSSDVSSLVLPDANIAFCNPKDCFLSNPLIYYILEIALSLCPLLCNQLFVQMSRERSSRNSHDLCIAKLDGRSCLCLGSYNFILSTGPEPAVLPHHWLRTHIGSFWLSENSSSVVLIETCNPYM